jgi:hypothetical protein
VPVDREKLKELTEKIQVGDADEGAEALAEAFQLARDEERADARQAVRQELVDMRLRQENDAALGKFAKRFKKLVDEPLLVTAATDVLKGEIEKDLLQAGLSDEVLQTVRGDVARLASLHGKARIMGHERVRSADKLLEDVGGVMSKKFNIKPDGVGRTPNEYVRDLRAERGFKRHDDDETAGRRSGSRAPASGSLTTEQSNRAASYVESLRAARGFAPRTPR